MYCYFAGYVNDTISSNEMLEHSIKNYYSNRDPDNNGEKVNEKVNIENGYLFF